MALLLSYLVTVFVSDTVSLLTCHCLRQWHCYPLILSLSPSMTLLLSYPVTVLRQWHCYSLILSLSPSRTLLPSYSVTTSVSDTATILSCHCLRQWRCYFLILSQSPSLTLLLSYLVSLRHWHFYSPILSLFSVNDTANLVQLVPYPSLTLLILYS